MQQTEYRELMNQHVVLQVQYMEQQKQSQEQHVALQGQYMKQQAQLQQLLEEHIALQEQHAVLQEQHVALLKQYNDSWNLVKVVLRRIFKRGS
jgi:hypothetical protein